MANVTPPGHGYFPRQGVKDLENGFLTSLPRIHTENYGIGITIIDPVRNGGIGIALYGTNRYQPERTEARTFKIIAKIRLLKSKIGKRQQTTPAFEPSWKSAKIIIKIVVAAQVTKPLGLF